MLKMKQLLLKRCGKLLEFFPIITILIILNNSLFSQATSRFQIVPIPGNINTPMQEFGPSLTADGKTLYFSSNMPGGFGGEDIWKVSVNGDEYGTPENLGAKINTEANESFPFITDDNVLFFSSNGKTLFLSVQHPGEQTTDLNNPTSRWPNGGLPKSSVITIEGPLLNKITSV